MMSETDTKTILRPWGIYPFSLCPYCGNKDPIFIRHCDCCEQPRCVNCERHILKEDYDVKVKELLNEYRTRYVYVE